MAINDPTSVSLLGQPNWPSAYLRAGLCIQQPRPPMKRSQAQQIDRAPSPTPTAFSGISNYPTESYCSIREAKNAPPFPTLVARIVVRTHFDELSPYLLTSTPRIGLVHSLRARSMGQTKFQPQPMISFHKALSPPSLSVSTTPLPQLVRITFINSRQC